MTKPIAFKDHFSAISRNYAENRPNYPPELFDFLASNCPGKHLAWDCGTGNGQCAIGLADKFDRVIASDASSLQIRHATPHTRISYLVSNAEFSAIRSKTVDLVTVAQALHWFSFEEYYQEVFRVLKPDGIAAVWCYGFCQISPEIDEIVHEFYASIVGRYWHPERRHVETGYASIPFPFLEREAPKFEIELKWTLDRFLAYLDTWSASKGYMNANHESPVDLIRERMGRAWGHTQDRRQVKWPIHLRIGESLRKKGTRGCP